MAQTVQSHLLSHEVQTELRRRRSHHREVRLPKIHGVAGDQRSHETNRTQIRHDRRLEA